MKTSFEHPVFDSLANDSLAKVTHHKRFTVTLIRPSDSDEVSMETISAPELSVAFMSARHIFPGARILSITQTTPPAPRDPQHNASAQTQQDPPQSPGARFIRGQFRPVVFTDESELIKLGD